MGAPSLTGRPRSATALRILGANLLRLRESEALAVRLEAAGVPALFLKGVALLETAYPDLAARPMADIDLLVTGRDLERAAALLADAAYSATPDALVWRKTAGRLPVLVDLHLDLWYFATGDFWRRARPRTPASRMRVLGAEDQLLHVILHSVVQDGAVSAQALADARAILDAERPGFRWETFVTTTRREGWARPALVFLEALDRAAPGLVPAETRRRLTERHGAGASPLRGRSAYARMLRGQTRWRGRGRLLLTLLFPPLAFLRLRYAWMPRPLGWLLPVCRPLLLLASLVRERLAR